MTKKVICLGVTIGVLTAGALYLAMKTGFFEDDSHLYDAFESTEE